MSTRLVSSKSVRSAFMRTVVLVAVALTLILILLPAALAAAAT
jgi:hypothetical protein